MVAERRKRSNIIIAATNDHNDEVAFKMIYAKIPQLGKILIRVQDVKFQFLKITIGIIIPCDNTHNEIQCLYDSKASVSAFYDVQYAK